MNLEQLIERANTRLSELGLDQIGDGRISARVNARNVRFLRQAGVISRPDGHGPGARWNENHLQQLVTARALQARGMSVTEVQQRIQGLDSASLCELEKESLTIPDEVPEIPACSSWQVAPGFILVSTRRQILAPAKLLQIQRILHTP
jgi:DNA-binding transcriptional MerR regulator